ncbi:MAG: glycosyltransferase family 4 protein [Vicinamibacterales bacterium]
MRVTLVLRCLTMMHGGGETRHLAWARELRAAGDEVTIITGRPLIGSTRHDVEPSTIVLRSPYMRDVVYGMQGKRGFGRLGSYLLHADEEWFCRAAWRAILALPHRPDIVHFHALSQGARLRRGGIPTVVNLPGAAAARYIEDLRLADAIIADGWAAEHLPAQIGRTIEHVPKGVDTDRFRPDGPTRRAALGLDGKRVALVVSRLVPIKNVALAIGAMGRLAAELPDLVMVVAGDGPLRPALESQAAALGLAGRITFAGRVPHDDLPAWYRSADLFVLPSEFDNSPNVVLEAMASGVPVVATDVGGLREYVHPGVNGDLVPSGDAASLARAMARYAGDRDLARRVGQRNRDDAVSRFSWAHSAQALRAVYRRVIEGRAHETPGTYRASA